MHEDLPASLTATRLSRRSQWVLLALILLGAVVLVVAIVLGKHVLGAATASDASASAEDHPTPDGFRPTKAQLVGLKIKPVGVESFRAEVVTEGSIAVNDEATTPVFSPYSGRVSKLIAKPGEVVRAGAPLMTVDANEFVQGQNDLIAARGGLETARAQLELAKTTEERQHQLFLAKAGAQKDYLQSQSDRIAAEGSFRTAEIALAAARDRLRILGRNDKQIAALEAGDAAVSSPEAAVLAPISGTVTQRQVGIGQYITSAAAGASSPVYSISDLKTVWMIGNVRDADVPLLHLGEPVEVNVFAFPDRVFKGRLTWIAAAVDPATHRLAVRADVDNPDGALRPAMFANFHIIVGEARSATGVPKGAIVYEGDEAHVWVLRDDGTLVIRKVETGRTHGDEVEIVKGLAAGEKVVTSGSLFIDRAVEG